MVLPRASVEHKTGDDGLINHLRTIAAAIAAYAGARLHLFGIESKEASAHYLKIAILLATGFFGVVIGYIFLCIAGVFILSALLHVSWMWILLGVAICHFILAAIAASIARSKFAQGMFGATINEFKKDHAWLTTPTPVTRQN